MTRFNKLIIIVSLLISLPTLAGSLKEGAFVGKHNGKSTVNLLLKEAPGRDGSFFALLMNAEEKMSLYIVDELNANSYAMTPLEVTSDGEIGIVNDDPSLVINLSRDKKGRQIFKIMNSNSGNNNGFKGFFIFEGKESKYSWLSLLGGEYKQGTNKEALQISDFDSLEREATAVFLTKQISGTFVIREKFPNMYLVNQNATFATGTTKKEFPKAIGVFVSKRGFGKKKLMILIDPKNDTNLKTFKKL